MTDLLARMSAPGAKKILTLDGGGIRGLITIEVLARVESLLQEQLGKPEMVLAEYFDCIAGTSTGAVIATCLALGMKVADVRNFYVESAPAMFDRASLLNRFRYEHHDDKLSGKLKAVFGADTKLGSSKLKTLLMLVLRNASTDSPWVLSNNPKAKSNQRTRRDGTAREDSNLELPLWQLVRASTAAPTYFPPEVVQLGKKSHVFVDGGSTIYNNPAFQAFLMATVEPYAVKWRAAQAELLVVSVGAGASASANVDLLPGDTNVIYNASSIPSALMHAALVEQDTLCRIFGSCRVGNPIDRELGDLHSAKGPTGADKMFTYLRYNVELSDAGLEDLGMDIIPAALVQPPDSVAHLEELQNVGQRLGNTVKPEHFAGFV